MKTLRLWKPCHGVPWLVLHENDSVVGEFGYMEDHCLKPNGACVGHLRISTPDNSLHMRLYVTFAGEHHAPPSGYVYDVAFDVQPLDEVCGLPDWEIRRNDNLLGDIRITVPDNAEWEWVEYEWEAM